MLGLRIAKIVCVKTNVYFRFVQAFLWFLFVKCIQFPRTRNIFSGKDRVFLLNIFLKNVNSGSKVVMVRKLIKIFEFQRWQHWQCFYCNHSDLNFFLATKSDTVL